MELVTRVFLLIGSVLAMVVLTVILYGVLKKLGEEAYLRPIEIPVIVEKWRDASVEEAPLNAPLIEP